MLSDDYEVSRTVHDHVCNGCQEVIVEECTNITCRAVFGPNHKEWCTDCDPELQEDDNASSDSTAD